MTQDSFFEDLVRTGMFKRPKGRPPAVKENTLRVRVTDAQLQKLEAIALKRGCSMSDVVRRWIEQARNPEQENKSNA
jgi:hypothetical protein